MIIVFDRHLQQRGAFRRQLAEHRSIRGWHRVSDLHAATRTLSVCQSHSVVGGDFFRRIGGVASNAATATEDGGMRSERFPVWYPSKPMSRCCCLCH